MGGEIQPGTTGIYSGIMKEKTKLSTLNFLMILIYTVLAAECSSAARNFVDSSLWMGSKMQEVK
jgi:hypothetical protein